MGRWRTACGTKNRRHDLALPYEGLRVSWPLKSQHPQSRGRKKQAAMIDVLPLVCRG